MASAVCWSLSMDDDMKKCTKLILLFCAGVLAVALVPPTVCWMVVVVVGRGLQLNYCWLVVVIYQ